MLASELYSFVTPQVLIKLQCSYPNRHAICTRDREKYRDFRPVSQSWK